MGVVQREARSSTGLSSVDFDFPGEGSEGLTHSIHPYPARFIPQIPRTLISHLSEPGDLVGDIFCGSGTTLVEALAQGRHCVGLDANPLAKVIAEAKIAQTSGDDHRALEQLSAHAMELSSIASVSGWRSTHWRPSGDYLSRWFSPTAVEELAECRHLANTMSGNAAKITLAAFSSIIVKASWQDSDTRYVRREKKIMPGNVLRQFALAVRRCKVATQEFSREVDPTLSRSVFHENALLEWPFGELDAIVTSPPYPNAFSYHLYHQTRMLWLKLDQPAFKATEIGSHRKYSATSRNRATAETFKDEMSMVMKRIRNHLRSGGCAAFVIGNSTIRGQPIDNVAILEGAAAAAGLLKEAEIPRSLQDGRKSFNPAIGRIKKEWVIVFSAP